MIIEVIAGSTLKITLSIDDMKEFDLTFDKLDRVGVETRSLLKKLIAEAKSEKDFEFSSGKLFVEAFENIDGSCIVYISAINSDGICDLSENKDEKNRPGFRYKSVDDRNSLYSSIVCEFDNIQKLKLVSEILYNRFSYIIKNSSLYYNDKKFRLILECYHRADKRLSNIFAEHEIDTETNEILALLTKEHFKCIISQDALSRIIA